MSRFLSPRKIEEYVADRHLTYLPLPYYVCNCITDYDCNRGHGKLSAIIMQHLGKESKAYSYTHDQLKYLAWQMVIALRFIHSKGYVRGDISPQNILIDQQGTRPYLINLALLMTKTESVKTYGNYAWCSDLDLPPIRPKTTVSNFHQLARVLIVLASGTLPWLSELSKNDNKQYDEKVRLRWCGLTI